MKDYINRNLNIKRRILLCAMLLCSLVAALVFIYTSANTVIIDDGTAICTVRTFGNKPSDAVSLLQLKPDDYKIISTQKSGGKTRVTIERAFNVTVTAGQKVYNVKTTSASVSDILKTVGIKPDEFDMVEPALDTVITKSTNIDFVDINYINEECTEVIPYEVKTVFSGTLPSGMSTVLSEGCNGLKLVNYTKKYVNGVEVEKLVNSEQIISPAVKCVKTVGTKGNASISTGVAVTTSSYANCYSTLRPATAIPLDENGVPTNYTSHIKVQATAYSYTGYHTSTGKDPQPGYVAVNPNFIPYGTRMYIISSDGNWVYGYAEAADTGGFALTRPTNIDLFFGTLAQCIAFGRRDIEVYFLP